MDMKKAGHPILHEPNRISKGKTTVFAEEIAKTFAEQMLMPATQEDADKAIRAIRDIMQRMRRIRDMMPELTKEINEAIADGENRQAAIKMEMKHGAVGSDLILHIDEFAKTSAALRRKVEQAKTYRRDMERVRRERGEAL